MTNGFQIVTSTLLDSLVRRDRGVSGGSCQVLAVLVGDVLSLAILVAFGETKVDDEDVVSGRLRSANQEIIRLDVTMNDPLIVHFFNSLDQLGSDEKNGFQVELPSTSLEEVFEGWSEQVHDHDMEVLVRDRAISTDVVQARHASYKNQKAGSLQVDVNKDLFL